MSDEKTSEKGGGNVSDTPKVEGAKVAKIQDKREAKLRARASEEGGQRIPRDVLRREAIMNVVTTMSLYPEEFGRTLRVIESSDRSRMIVEMDSSNVCHLVPDETIKIYVMDYLYTKWIRKNTGVVLTGTDAPEIINLFKTMYSQVLIKEEDIKPVGVYGRDEPCWSRLEWPLSPGDTPTYDELFGRMSDPKVVKAWIGSLFHHDADRSQYIWITSEGGDGKSSLANVVARCLGPGAASEVIPLFSDKFWTSGIVGKRFVCFPDAGKESFVGSDMFKSLTGDAYQKIEFKGKTPISLKLTPKFMFLSNKKPNISRSNADIRRAIIIELEKAPNYMAPKIYDEMLWKEAPHFIHDCLQVYKEMCPYHERLPVSDAVQEAVEEQIGEDESNYDMIFSERLHDCRKNIRVIMDKNGCSWEKACTIGKHPAMIEATTLQKIMYDFGLKQGPAQSKFLDYLKKKYGVKKKRLGPRLDRQWVYLGVRTLVTGE